MIPFTLSEVALVLHAEWIGQDRIIQTISINSAQITTRCLFVALPGKYFDGHDFVDQAVFMGAEALLVNYYIALNIPQLVVSDTYCSLAQLGSWVRKQISSKIIAITGSSGKTSVKEMTTSILKNEGQVLATQGNFNNTLGVSLTLLGLTYKDDFAVIEMGANNFREILWMSSLVRPDVALVNNIFSAHLSGFKSLFGVAEAKGEIFSGISGYGVSIFNADNNAWLLWKKSFSPNSVLSFSIYKKDGVDFFASNIICNRDHVKFILHTPYGSSPVRLSMLGIHNVSNALAASALSFSVGAKLNSIVFGLEKVSALPGRLFPIFINHRKLLLDDTYNSNIGSILASVRVLESMSGYRVIVLGDVLDLGSYVDVTYHQAIAKLIAISDIDQVLSFGYLSCCVSRIGRRGEHFYNKNILVMRLIQLLCEHEVITILIKGSRNMLMDQLVVELQDQIIC